MVTKKCVTCNCKIINDVSSVIFPCPGCNKKEIIRCSKCRKTGAEYLCECGFEGP